MSEVGQAAFVICEQQIAGGDDLAVAGLQAEAELAGLVLALPNENVTIVQGDAVNLWMVKDKRK